MFFDIYIYICNIYISYLVHTYKGQSHPVCAEVEPSSPKSSDSQGSRRGVMFRNRESVRGPSVFWLDFICKKSMLFVGKMFSFVLGNLHLIYLYWFQFKFLTFNGVRGSCHNCPSDSGN